MLHVWIAWDPSFGLSLMARRFWTTVVPHGSSSTCYLVRCSTHITACSSIRQRECIWPYFWCLVIEISVLRWKNWTVSFFSNCCFLPYTLLYAFCALSFIALWDPKHIQNLLANKQACCATNLLMLINIDNCCISGITTHFRSTLAQECVMKTTSLTSSLLEEWLVWLFIMGNCLMVSFATEDNRQK